MLNTIVQVFTSEETLATVIAIVVILSMIAYMSGFSGNQARYGGFFLVLSLVTFFMPQLLA